MYPRFEIKDVDRYLRSYSLKKLAPVVTYDNMLFNSFLQLQLFCSSGCVCRGALRVGMQRKAIKRGLTINRAGKRKGRAVSNKVVST